MPATEAQVRANRENAQKSTGPRTDAGKAKARMNALKHGMRSRGGLVLPQEDPAELEARIDLWIADWEPQNAIERELVERAARASWALERAERCEAALVSKRVRKAVAGSRAKRAANVEELGRKLLQNLDSPAAIVAELGESPEGVRWLLGRWEEFRALIAGEHEWSCMDQNKFVWLLGKKPFDAIVDLGLNAIFLAWDVLEEGDAADFWEFVQKSSRTSAPAYGAWASWRVLAPRPADEAEAWARLGAVVEREVARLHDLLAELEEVEEDDVLERAEAASFLAGDAGERLRRYQSARSRELFRAVQLLSKLRKDAAKFDRDRDGLPPSRGKVAAQRPDEGGSAPLQESAVESASDGGRPPQLTPAASAFPREGGRPSPAAPDPKRHDAHPAPRLASSREEEAEGGRSSSKNATNEPDAEEAEAAFLREVKSMLASATTRERTRPGAAAG